MQGKESRGEAYGQEEKVEAETDLQAQETSLENAVKVRKPEFQDPKGKGSAV